LKISALGMFLVAWPVVGGLSLNAVIARYSLSNAGRRTCYIQKTPDKIGWVQDFKDALLVAPIPDKPASPPKR
jgi:hypothetical protein